MRLIHWRDCGLRHRSVLAFLALLLLLHGAYSVTPDLGPRLRDLAFLAGSVVLTLLLVGFWIAWRPLFANAPPQTRAAAPGPCDALLAAGMIVTAAYFSLPNRLALSLIAVFVVAQAVILGLGRRRMSLLASCGTVLAAFAVVIARTNINHLGADMLPVSVWADQVFLQGHNPYFSDYTSVTPGPFYYLPVQWLIYLPFVAMHLDVRLLNFASLLGMIGLLALLWRDLPRPWTGFALLLAIIACRPSTEMVYQGEVWPLWFLVSAFVVAYYRERMVVAAVLLGLLLACNQTTLVLAALLGVHQLRTGRWRETLLLGAIVLAVYAAIVVPFARGVVAFIDQNYITLPHLAGIMSERTYRNAITQVSLVNVLTRLGLIGLRAKLQVLAGLAGMASVAAWRGMTKAQFLAICGLVYLVTVGLNTQVWKYYYVQGLILLFWSLMAPGARTAPAP